MLAADRSIEEALRGLLSRPKAIGIRPIEFETHAHPRRDPGCYQQAHAFLAPLRRQYRHAIVVFDRHGCGTSEPVAAIEGHVRVSLQGSGWGPNSDVIVIDPELEVWVWSDSPKVDEALQWSGRKPRLRPWLEGRGVWSPGHPKPPDPKAAVRLALREVKIPPSASIYGKLARSVSVERCADPAFGRLRERLRTWFPAT